MMMNSHSSIPLKVGENYEKIIIKIINFFFLFLDPFLPYLFRRIELREACKITSLLDFETF